MPTHATPFTDPEEAARSLASALARPADAPPTARGVAIALFRRHLARIQGGVREKFEQHLLDGDVGAVVTLAEVDGHGRAGRDFELTAARLNNRKHSELL